MISASASTANQRPNVAMTGAFIFLVFMWSLVIAE